MSLSPLTPCSARTRRFGPAISLFSMLALLIPSVLLVGCGGGQDEDQTLATVGSTEIKASYYEDRLVKLEENELPRAEDGTVLDMSALDGKKEFLQTLINKEIMVQTAETMGLNNEADVVTAREHLTAYHASTTMWERAILVPAKTISPEELEAFHAKMGSSRPCLYVICNFREDAEAAQKMAQGGADWEDVVNQFHDGGEPPTGLYEITVPFGRYNAEFENKVFNTEIGGITPPIETVYGYWVLKVLKENPGKKPPMEEAQSQILDVTFNRKMAHLKEEFKTSVEEKFQFTIHEEALWKCYLGLPEGETLFREGTQEPRSKEELRPLEVASEDMDLPFYSYLNREGELQEYSLLDYKIVFDNMSVFQRPKDTEMLGGLRSKIEAEIGKTILNYEAQDRGLYEDPEVVAKVDLKIEEMVVNKLYMEVVNIDERVTAEDLDAFWAENSQDYVDRENRSGRLVICRSEELAAEARTALAEGMTWKDALVSYGVDVANKSKSGKVEKVVETRTNPISMAMFSLQPGELSQPFALGDGRFAVVLLESVTPEWMRDLSEVSEAVGVRIRELRKEDVFQAKMDEWSEKIPVTIFEDKLADLASWKELTTFELPEGHVPVN